MDEKSRLVLRKLFLVCPGWFWADVENGEKSPPESGGVPSRSEGGAVCSKLARSALLVDFREALLFLIGALREL
jgi:hypothetical protein